VVLRGNVKDAAPTRGFLPSGSMNSRAALLSGDPGLGKTTTARLIAK
jgi:replication-associated recombination protein RarA